MRGASHQVKTHRTIKKKFQISEPNIAEQKVCPVSTKIWIHTRAHLDDVQHLLFRLGALRWRVNDTTSERDLARGQVSLQMTQLALNVLNAKNVLHEATLERVQVGIELRKEKT